MLVLSESFHYVPILVHGALLEKQWRRSDLYLESWERLPPCQWFYHDEVGKPIAFLAGLACLGQDDTVGFTNGRHRTRWILSLGLLHVPVCVPFEQIDAWMATDLVEDVQQPIEVPGLKARCSGRPLKGSWVSIIGVR